MLKRCESASKCLRRTRTAPSQAQDAPKGFKWEPPSRSAKIEHRVPTLILPHQTHPGAENALFLPKKGAQHLRRLNIGFEVRTTFQKW